VRWVVAAIVLVIAMHHAALGTIPHAMAATSPMVHATIAYPQSCSMSTLQQPLDPCVESCAVLQNAAPSRVFVAPTGPSGQALHAVGSHFPGRHSLLATANVGLTRDAGCSQSPLLQALRI
jgi:hypothetical protein